MINSLCRMLIIFCWLTSSVALGIEPQWSFKAPLGIVDSTPAVADVDQDGKPELIATTTAGSVLVVDRQGQMVWMRGVQIPISLSPTVADLIEGPELEVLVLNQSGSLYCMDGRSGDVLWRYDLPGSIEWGVSAIVAVDLDGDGNLEVVAGDNEGHVVCISSQGELLWQYDGPHGSTYCPAVGPLNGEEKPSVLISGSQVPLVCLSHDGKERWRVDKSGKGASPILADIDGDGDNEVVTGLGNSVMAVDGKGKVLWEHPMKKELDGTLCAADADEDGALEIFAIDLAGHFAAIGSSGKTLWTANLVERVRRSPVIGDIDGGGDIEVVVGGYSGELYLFTGKGELKATHTMQAITNASPIIADLEGDGTPTLIYTPDDGAIVAYRWANAQPNAKVLWPEYRYDSARKGMDTARIRSPVRIADVNFGDNYVGANTIELTIENPEDHPLAIEVTIDSGHGKPRKQHFQRQGKRIDLEAKYTITGTSPSTVRIDCSVFDNGQLVTQRRNVAHVVPFRKELNDLAAILKKVQASAAKLPEAYAILGQVAAIKGSLTAYEQQALVAGTLDDTKRRRLRDALRDNLRLLGRLDLLVKAALKNQATGAGPLQLSAANPWAPFGGLDEIVEGRLQDADLSVELFSKETEAAALNVFNFGTKSVLARVEIDDFSLEGEKDTAAVLARDVVALHEVVNVPTQTLDTSADALPRMNDANVVTLPCWDARQVWLNIDAKHLSPGTWKSTVRVRTLDVESREFVAPITVTVWKSALPEEQPLRHCNWGYVHNSRHKYYEDQSLEDRVDHGNNVFVSTFVPRVQFDEDGKLVGQIDYARHDEFVKKYSPHGVILFHNTGGVSGPGKPGSETYRKAYHQWMREWVRHLREMGVGYDGYAMYPVDEPGLRDGLVDLYLQNAKLTRESDPKVQMYTDPVMRITAEELTEMLPYVDIWCPNRVGFLLDVGADKLEIIKNSGAKLWTYECDGNAKHQSPLGYYRGQSWLAWRHGLTGIGFWSYCTSSADPWFKPTNTQDYLMTYQGDRVVSSKRWEAVRDGIEDYSMLSVLRAAVKKAKAEGRNPQDVASAESLLGERAFAISQFCDKDSTTPGKAGLPGVRKLADRQLATIQATRKEIEEAIVLLSP